MSELIQKKLSVLVAVRDLKADYYGNPVVCRSTSEAIRQFGDLCSDEKCLPGQHPEDFQLVLVGHFDPDSGVITPVISILANGSDFRLENKE